jgi:AdoMet-dependent heme synthase
VSSDQRRNESSLHFFSGVRVFSPAFPLHVVFILDTRCNLSCTHCSSAASRRSRAGFDTAGAQRVISEIAELGVVDLALSGGEPLLRRDLERLIGHACSLGLTVGTSTNGFALTKARAASLRDAGLGRLQVSLDGLACAHDRIRGTGSFDRAIKAIRTGVAAGLRTHVCFTAMRSNIDSLEDCIALAMSLGVHGLNLSQFVATGRGAQSENLLPEQARMAIEVWSAARASRPDMYFTAHAVGPFVDGSTGGGCQAGRAIACVTSTGDVTPCVMLPLVLGNLTQRTFREIWTGGEVLDRLRARKVRGACGACALREQCGGCRAAAWAHTGDLYAADPQCWNPALAKEVQCHTSSSTVRSSDESGRLPA